MFYKTFNKFAVTNTENRHQLLKITPRRAKLSKSLLLKLTYVKTACLNTPFFIKGPNHPNIFQSPAILSNNKWQIKVKRF